MKMLTAKVGDGYLGLPEGTLEEGMTVTSLGPETESGTAPTAAQRQDLAQALEADRGEGGDGWQLLAALLRA